MVKCKKSINHIVIALSLAIFTLAGCNFPENNKTALIEVGNREELKALNYDLVKLVYNGGSEREVKVAAKKINSISELVIIGKILSQQTAGSENPRFANYNGYFTLEVESVKRGYYPHDKIRFLFGVFATNQPVMLYPGYVKTRYHSGDRVKVFLNYFDELGGYAAVAGFYSIQPYYLL